MSKVHLADIPRQIGGRKCDLQSGGDAMLVHLVHVVNPDRHPDALVALFVSVLLKRGWCSGRGRGLPAPPDKERCKVPCPIQPRQTSEACPSPTISSIPTSQTTPTCWRCRRRSISESTLGFHNGKQDNTRWTEGCGLLLQNRCDLEVAEMIVCFSSDVLSHQHYPTRHGVKVTTRHGTLRQRMPRSRDRHWNREATVQLLASRRARGQG